MKASKFIINGIKKILDESILRDHLFSYNDYKVARDEVLENIKKLLKKEIGEMDVLVHNLTIGDRDIVVKVNANGDIDRSKGMSITDHY